MANKKLKTPEPIPAWIETFGSLVYDLCLEILNDPLRAEIAFVSIAKEIKKNSTQVQFKEFQRTWILKNTCDHLLRDKRPSSLRFHKGPQGDVLSKLSIEERLLVLLRDKYGLPYPEIAGALGIPDGTLKLRRAQALRSLKEWSEEWRQGSNELL